MQRRFFLRQTTKGAATAAASPLIGLAASLRAEAESGKSTALIDTHVSLDRWPFARIRPDTAETLADQLHENGVAQAWAGSFDALLHHDLDAVNDRLAATAKAHSIFQPMAAINPATPSWKRTLSRCVDTHRMRGIRLHPDFHDYRLDDPAFLELLDMASSKGLLVQISLGLNCKLHPVTPRIELSKIDLTPLISNTLPCQHVQLLDTAGHIRSAKVASDLAAKGIQFQTTNGTEKWVKTVPQSQIHFGSGAPFHRWAPLDTDALTPAQITAISSHNAENLMLRA